MSENPRFQVRIAQWAGKHIAYLPLYLAMEAGYFADEGIEVEIYRAGNDNDIHAEVASGRAHFGVGDPTFVAIGASSGARTKVIAALVNNLCLWGLTHHDEIREIREVTDLVGLRVGVPPRPSTTYSLLAGLKRRHERMLRTMEVVEAPIDQQASLLAGNRADLIIELEPMVSVALQQGLRSVLSLGDFYGAFLLTGIMTRQDLIDGEPGLLGCFVRALQRGLNLVHQDDVTTVRLSAAIFPALPQECLNSALGRLRMSRAWPRQALIELPAWNAALELRRDLGDIKGVWDPGSFLDQRFAYKVLATARDG